MIYLVCQKCHSAIRVVGVLEGVAYLEGVLYDMGQDWCQCWEANCDGKVEQHEKPQEGMHPIHELEPREAVAALHGLGLPPERECGPSAIRAVFSSLKVERVAVEQMPGANRSRIDHIVFEDGTKMYFGSSAYGALIYRIARPHSYVEALEDEVGS